MVDRSISPAAAVTLRALAPSITNVIGFYDLLYEQETAVHPVRRAMHEAHFTTSALHLAVALRRVLEQMDAEK